MDPEELSELGLSQVGLKARSPEGHAARAMYIKGDEYIWVEIQEKTFKNWVNEQIRPLGMSITNLQTDFNDGLKLIALIEVLQKRKLKKIRKPLNQHQCLENVQTALQAMASDNIKLVNIGNTDIVEGNLKLILGLIWSLILRYQIGRTNFPPKKLMLSWLQAALPNLHIANFTSDWNSGIALSALLDYCRPGLIPHWKSLSIKNSIENCRTAMHLARDEFNIPMILTPEDLASHNLDELSGMTYLSYFMKDDSPGYKATLGWVQKQLPQFNIRNFTTDWNDGLALCALVKAYGAHVPDYTELRKDRSFWEQNIQHGIIGGESLGIRPLLKPKELSDPEVEHLGVMAYIARFQWVKPIKRLQDKISISGINLNNVHIDKPAKFRINFLDNIVDEKKIRVEVRHENKKLDCQLSFSKTGGSGSFTPTNIGMHELLAFYEDALVTGCPLHIKVHPDISKILYSGIDPCALGLVVEVLINSNGVENGNMVFEAQAPSGKLKKCSVIENEGVYTATFTTDEIGEWKILVTYDGRHIHGSPFSCYVYDPTKVKLQGLGTAVKGKDKTFMIDASASGWGELKLELLYNSISIPVSIDEQGNGIYMVTFQPLDCGKYQLNVAFNSINIKGSPFTFKVVESEKDLKGSEYDNHVEDRLRKDKFVSSKEIHRSHLPFEGHNISQSKSGENGLYTKNNEVSKHTFGNGFTSRDSHQSLNKKTLGNISSQENLSFHQRAELVNSKLMAHKENVKTSKAPAPPTPKKPISHESSFNMKLKEEERLNITKQQTKIFQENTFDQIISNRNSTQFSGLQKVLSDSTDSVGAKPKVHLKKGKDTKEFDSSVNNTKHEINDYGYMLSSKHKKEAIDISQVVTEGEGLKLVPVKQPTTFSLQAPWLKQDDIQVTVTAPSGREIPFRLEFVNHGRYQVEYITPEVGEHSIEINVAGKRLIGSPFQCFAYDVSQIKVGKIPNGTVGKPVEFEINGAEAGSGNLEILVNGGRVTSNVKSLGNHCFLDSFIPHTSTTHTIEMKFNGHHVPGSPWKCEVSETSKPLSVKGEALKSFSTRQPASFEIAAFGYSKENVKVNVYGPTKTPIQPKIFDYNNGVFRVEFNAFEVGNYTIETLVDGHHLPGSPFATKAYSSAQIHVLDAPKTCTVGHTCQFQVDASQAGEGQLEISVNDGKVPNDMQVLGNGRCLVSFEPQSSGPHKIDIRFNGENVPGCPLVIEATEYPFLVEVSSQDLVPVNKVAHFNINVKGSREADLKVSVTSPNGGKIPVKIFPDAKSGFIGEFLPKDVGHHLLSVEYGGRKDASTPYTIKVYDALQVKLGRINDGFLGKTYQFTVDASNAGEGNLEITVSGHGRNIPTHVDPLGNAKFAISFVPSDLADHFISIAFNKEVVPGSPFKVKMSDPQSKVSVTTTNQFSAVNKAVNFSLHGLSKDNQNHSIEIEGPDGNVIPYKLKELADNSFKLEFIPQKTGEYRTHVLINNDPVADSPFITKVYDIKQIKVKEIPKGIIGKPVTFIVEKLNAGPGNLEVVVNKGQVPTVPQAQSPTQYAISFTPQDSKRHIIDIRFNGEAVPGSPFECYIVDSAPIKVKGDGIEKVPVNCPASFIIDTGGIDVGEVHCTVIGPNQLPLKCFLHGNYHSGYRVEYTPVDVGDHAVDVRVDGQAVASSPYLVKVYNSQQVKVTDVGPGVVGKPVYFNIDASQAGAGNLEIIVSVGGRNVPNYVQSEGNARFRVNFKPTEAQPHILSVKFNGEPVPGSPCSVKITDSSQSVVTGSSLRMTSIAQGAHFTVDTRSFENGVCKVVVTGPSTKNVPVIVKKTSSTTFDVSFNPQEMGPHQVLVTLDDQPLPGSPFTCNVYDVSKVKVSKLVPGIVGKPCTFQVDASQAGEGTLELVVTTRKSSVRAEVSMRSRGLYDVTFVPQDKISHYVNITFNAEDVPGSPFKIEVSAPSRGQNSVMANGEGLKQGLVGSINAFDIETNGVEGNIEVNVTGPNGCSVPASVHNIKHDSYRVEYQTHEIGTYKIEVLHQGSMISSKPFLVEVCDPSRVKVIDVEDGIIGRDQIFKVDASRAGRGNLNLSITASGREVKYNLREITSGVYEVAYIPHSDHPHKIDVFYNGHQAPGCPQIVEIRDPSHSIIAHGSGLKSSQCGKTASFFIETGGFGEAKDFDILVISPLDSPLPVKCFQQKDGSLLAEWPAQQAGNHKIEVLYSGKAIAGSPFSCQVFDASKVALQKIKTTNFAVGEDISFTLNRRDAGYAELDVTVTSPLGRHLPIEVKGTSDGEGELIEFTPTVPGKYKIAITYGGIEVPGSPVTFIAQDSGVPKIEGLGLLVAQVECPATFKILAQGLWGHPQVTVDGPETEAEVMIEEEEEGVYNVCYVPLEIGLFDVKVMWNNKEVPGSPYHPRVVNTSKMRVIGGLENIVDEQNHIPLIVGEEKRIPFDVSDAGPGKPKAEVRSPSGIIPSKFDQTGNHRYHLLFVPKEKGEHQIYVYFADLPLPASPFLAYSEELGPAPDHTRVVLRGHGLTGAKVGEEAEFVIDGSEAGPGSPEVTLGGVKADISVQIVPLGNNVYKVQYTPTVPGAYLLNVMWSERQVKGCPLKVNVSASYDAQKVACSGEGLRGGTVGKEIKSFIDTRKAGPGELTAHCMGPHKVAYCELYDHRDGTFTLYLKPQEGGRHVLTIKYGGEHVPGSPFTIRIAGAPDASKVRVYGPGIEPGVLAIYQSRFICDTRGAGAGQLTVRIRGPKGAFRVEMQRESQKDRTILCKYDPTEPGDYRLEVKWSGEHVPGSPFMVMIFDTQEELNHYIQGQYQSQSGGHPPLPPADYFGGSLTYSTGFGQMSWRGSTAEL